MELVTLARHMIQDVAEQAAGYRIGQTALRHLDRALWVVEKCARWAVPPPLDQDDKPQPELVRPLPWVFFLAMLIALRVTRESISLVNLVLGKPPLRSADVVMYIQSKRRYLRTLKYQGNRKMRARNAPQNEPWYSSIQALFEFTMCFRRSQNYGNNNTTRVSNNEEILVVKRGKRTRDPPAAAAAGENTMERLIEKMMVDLDADSDDDSSFTLTNATSNHSDNSDSDDTTLESNAVAESTITSAETGNTELENMSLSPIKSDLASSTPEKILENNLDSPKENNIDGKREKIQNGVEKEGEEKQPSKAELSEPLNDTKGMNTRIEDNSPKPKNKHSPKEESKNFLQSERCSPQKQQSKQTKFANGRTMSVPSNKKKGLNQTRDADGAPIVRVSPADEAF